MKKIITIIQSFLPYLTVFIASIYRPIDPDLGWHLKYGEYFFNNLRILRENTFSSEMPGYIWANISWGADLVYYLFYALGGFFGLTLGGALVVVVTFYFFAKAFDLDYWEKAIIFPLILFFMNPVNSNSFRGQQLSLLLLGILIYILKNYEKNKSKLLYLTPVLFLVWANTHGLFVVGLGIFLVWQFFYMLSVFISLKKLMPIITQIKIFFILTLTTFLFTLIHPYGFKIYEDALHHFNDPLLKRVAEYLPAVELSAQWMNLIFVLILAGIGILIYIFKNTWRENLPQIGVFTVLYILSWWVRRYSWMMYYQIIPFLKPIAQFIKPDSKKGTYSIATILFISYLSILLVIKYPYGQFMDMNWDIYCSVFSKCSPQAAEVLRNFYAENKTMTLYNWGGWLIWNYPDMKPSTDGRMHLWRDEHGFSAFENNYALEQNMSDIDKSKYEVVYTATYKPIYKRLTQLAKENKWDLVFKDDTTVIYTRLKR